MPKQVFIHVGDAHLDSASSRGADRVAALTQLVRYVETLDNLAAVIWPGDLFDGESSTEDRNAIAPIIQQLAGRAPLLIVPGNHDRPGELEILERLRTRWPVHVVTHPSVIRLRTTLDPDARVFCLPYVHKAGLVGAGVEHADLGAEAARLLDAMFLAAGDELRQAQVAGDVTLMAMHMNVGGAKTGPGQPQIGREIELTPALLARLPENVAIMANHIHLHQEIHGAVYAGSIARMDFGENDAKGFLQWTFDDVERSWAYSFIPLDVPPQWLIDGRLTRDGFTPDAPLPAMAGADVRVRYRFTKAEHAALDVAHIYAAVAGCRSLKLEGVPELEHTVRAPEIATAQTLEAKVTRCAELQGVAVTPGLLQKLSAIQNQSTESMLSALVDDDVPAGVT